MSGSGLLEADNNDVSLLEILLFSICVIHFRSAIEINMYVSNVPAYCTNISYLNQSASGLTIYYQISQLIQQR